MARGGHAAGGARQRQAALEQVRPPECSGRRTWPARHALQRLAPPSPAPRHVAHNVRDVQQHLQKLRSISELAALVAGFTINSAFLNFQYELPSGLLPLLLH